MGRFWMQRGYNQTIGLVLGIAAWVTRCLCSCVLRRRPSKQRIGQLGENLVARFLLRRGFLIVGRRVTRFGAEMDIVGVDFQKSKPELVVVEVKTRRSLPDRSTTDPRTKNYPLVSYRQMRRLQSALSQLARLYDISMDQARVDIVLVHWPINTITPTVYRTYGKPLSNLCCLIAGYFFL